MKKYVLFLLLILALLSAAYAETVFIPESLNDADENVTAMPETEPGEEDAPVPDSSAEQPAKAAENAGSYKNVRITVNGDKIILLDENDEQQKSYIADGRIYVPIAPFIAAIGGDLQYDEGKNQLTITLPQTTSQAVADPAQETQVLPAATSTPEPKRAQELEWNERVELDFVQFTLSEFKTLREIRGDSKIGVYLSEKAGSKYLAAIGTIKNNTGGPIISNRIKGNMLIDGQNTFTCKAGFIYNESITHELPATASARLYIYAEVPDEIALSLGTAEITFGFFEGFKDMPVFLERADYLYLIRVNGGMAENAREEPVREKTFYEDSPSLPVPTSYADLTESGHSSSKANGKVTKNEYRYRAHFKSDQIADLADKLIKGLQEDGYKIGKSGSSYVVSNGSKKLATISYDSTQIKVNISPGNETLRTVPAKPTSAANTTIEEVKLPTTRIGGRLSTSYAEMTFEKSGKTSQLLSYTTKNKPRSWRFYEPNSASNQLFYIQGVFRNMTSREVNISNTYAELTFDGKERYNCSVTSLYGDGRDFTTRVIAQDKVEYYIYAEVPKSVLNSYKKCELKVGFTKDFNIRSLSNGVYNFDVCDDVIVVELSK